MRLDDDIIQTFKVAKKHNTHKQQNVQSLDYSMDGRHMVATTSDNSVILYDCKGGSNTHTINCNKYGAAMSRFTHDGKTVVQCSTKGDHTLRHLALSTNQYLSYFRQHTARVISLVMSPLNRQTFLSAGLDKSVCVWDFRQKPCCAVLNTGSARPITAYDPKGVQFAVAYNSQSVRIHDLRYLQEDPNKHSANCTEIKLEHVMEPTEEWLSLQVSPTSKSLLVTTTANKILLVDVERGRVLNVITSCPNSIGSTQTVSFSPDGGCIFCGAVDGRIFVYDGIVGNLVHILDSDHPRVTCLNFNPKFALLTSACDEVYLWTPEGVPN